ncbi:unnamed protein product, partial [Gongylonema pulchrum]|uniref:Acyl-CoA dehydrogenase n=1 Tax=Gongylonema pulchrum TaxID=637853 RepID=A0A183F030_9BILA
MEDTAILDDLPEHEHDEIQKIENEAIELVEKLYGP